MPAVVPPTTDAASSSTSTTAVVASSTDSGTSASHRQSNVLTTWVTQQPSECRTSAPSTTLEPITETTPPQSGPPKKSRQSNLKAFTSGPMSATRRKKIDQLLLKMIVKDLHPLSIVEEDGNAFLITNLIISNADQYNTSRPH